MRYEAYSSDTAVAAKARSPRRRREICRSFTCISPWFILWRWFNGGKSRVSRTKSDERNWGKAEIDGDLDVEREIGMVSSSSREDSSVEIGKEASFNHGIGYGLIYLVRNELNKMVELRKRVESLLQHIQTEIENQDDRRLSIPSRSSISSSLAKACVQEIMYAEEHHSSPNDVEIGFGREKSSRMDRLEAELEAEFNRLQMDGEFSHHEVNAEHNAPELSLNMCYEEVSELHGFSNDDFCGVSPRDLERRLHEVLELRQQERISELESALDYAMQQLEEKETELSLWQDAARLVARRLPAFSSILIQSMKPEFEVGETGRRSLIYKYNIQTI